MDKALREFFAALRDERGLTQTQVATRGGVKQSTISKIEIEPAYEPSVSSFRRAIQGLGLTTSAFFLRFEGVVGASIGDASTKDDPNDPFESEARIAQNVLRLLTEIANNGVGRREDERPKDDRLSADTRALAAERHSYDRKNRRRDVPETPKRRRVKKKRPPKHD